TSTLPNLAERAAGEAAMSRLADRLTAMAPPPMNLSPSTIAHRSPAVSAALSASAAIARRADERARRSRSVIGLTVDSFISACSFVSYALVALGLRLIMARVFFLDGQTRIEGPRLSFSPADYVNLDVLRGLNFSVVLPMQVKAETFTAFSVQYPPIPVPPTLAAYLVSYAEFLLPVMLVLGLGTRFAALGLLIMTAMISIFVVPHALFTTHIFWAAILLVLISRGPGQISVDHIIRTLARR
ncbi:MAG: DoxX family protein, partial [Pseudolabrys sp.]|nr:DoxX family protein [Pseudolabrys sp.]